MSEFRNLGKEFILIESVRTLRKHIKDENKIDEILKEKFKLNDEQIEDIKEKEKKAKPEKWWDA